MWAIQGKRSKNIVFGPGTLWRTWGTRLFLYSSHSLPIVFEKILMALVLILRQRKRKPGIVRSDQEILTPIKLISHGSIGDELSQVDVPESLARSWSHGQKVSL
jgi:hypothetical protein